MVSALRLPTDRWHPLDVSEAKIMNLAHASYLCLATVAAISAAPTPPTAVGEAQELEAPGQNQVSDEWREYQTRYVVITIPKVWKEHPGHWERVRIDSPDGMFVAAVWIGTHEKGKWSSLEQFASESRREFSHRTINGAEWMETRRDSEGSTEVTLVALFHDELVEVMFVHENEPEQRAKYSPVVDRMIESLELPIREPK